MKETQRVLVLACSASKTKQSTGQPVPPHFYYDGPAWRTLRAWHRKHPHAMLRDDVLVYALSAEHGLVPWDKAVEQYDRKLDDSRADFLANSGYSTGTEAPDAWTELGRVIGDVLNPDVLFVGSSLYARVFADWMQYGQPDVMWRAACDGARGIGDMLGELRTWLHQSETRKPGWADCLRALGEAADRLEAEEKAAEEADAIAARMFK